MANTEFNVEILTQSGAWIDYRNPIPGNSYTWREERRLDNVRKIIYHHTVTDQWHDAQREADHIANIHLGRGYGGVAYHIIVSSEVSKVDPNYAIALYVGDLGTVRAHAVNTRGMDGLPKDAGNWYSIGISMVGDFTKYRPMQEQLNTLNAILEKFLHNDSRFPNLYSWDHVAPHNYWDQTACPGNKWDYDEIKRFIPLVEPVSNIPTEDPIMIEELNKKINDMQSQMNSQNQAILSLTALKQQDDTTIKTLSDEKTALHIDLQKALATINSQEITINDLTSRLNGAIGTIESQNIKISGLEEAMAKYKSDSSTVVLPHNKFERLERIFTGTHTWKEKFKSIFKDFGFALQNSAGGGLFTVGTFNIWLDAMSYFDKSIPLWVNVLVITAAFLIGYNTTKSVSKNIFTKNSFTLAKAYVAKNAPDKLDELELVEKALLDKDLLK